MLEPVKIMGPESAVLQPLESRSSLLMNNPASAASTLESVKLSLSRASEAAAASNSLKKPKKGLGTAKQRLGKILKLKFWRHDNNSEHTLQIRVFMLVKF